nr:hypothetical protein [Tanacetum cinerariifolium]
PHRGGGGLSAVHSQPRRLERLLPLFWCRRWWLWMTMVEDVVVVPAVDGDMVVLGGWLVLVALTVAAEEAATVGVVGVGSGVAELVMAAAAANKGGGAWRLFGDGFYRSGYGETFWVRRKKPAGKVFRRRRGVRPKAVVAGGGLGRPEIVREN